MIWLVCYIASGFLTYAVLTYGIGGPTVKWLDIIAAVIWPITWAAVLTMGVYAVACQILNTLHKKEEPA